MAVQKLSQLTDGTSLVTATDKLVAVRGGNTQVLVAPGALAAIQTVNSANLITAVGDATGTGLIMGNNTPTIITPSILQINSAGTAGTGVKGRTDGNPASAGNIGELIDSNPGVNFNYVPTLTIASPGNVLVSGINYLTGQACWFFNNGDTLPTGLAFATTYYWIRIDANNGRLATSVANAHAGTAINFTGSQSGTHALRGGAIIGTTGTTIDACGIKPGSGLWDITASFSFLSESLAVLTGIIGGLAKNTSNNPFAFLNQPSLYRNGFTDTFAGALALQGSTTWQAVPLATNDIIYSGMTAFFSGSGDIRMCTGIQFKRAG